MSATAKDTTRIYWNHAKKYPWHIFTMLSSVAITVGAELYRPFLYKEFFDLLATRDPSQLSRLTAIIFLVFAVYLLFWVFTRVATFTWDFYVPRVITDLNNSSFAYLLNHSYRFFSDNFIGSLHRRVHRFSRSFESILSEAFWRLYILLLKIIVVFGVLYVLHRTIAFYILIWTILFLICNVLILRYKNKFDVIKADLDTQAGGLLADTITNQVNLKLFNGFKNEYEKFTKLTEEIFRYRKLSWNIGSYVEAFQNGAMIVLEVTVMYVALLAWQRGDATIGDFALLQGYLIALFNSLWDIERSMRTIYESFTEANEMTDILLEDHEIVDLAHAKPLALTHGEVALNEIGFSYNDGKKVFDNFSLAIKSGERVALIGASGSGKSTITKLLLRFYDIQTGTITIDGQNIRNITLESLRNAISLVPQEPILFHRSIKENIRYAKPDASDEEVINAAKLAHCHEFIMELSHQYDTFVGERGVKLSGGERQRVAIARAILKNAPILILDEATSSLDSESERFIQDALKTLMKNKTTIVIAHRLSTIMQMDRIVVLEKGKIIEEGSHDSLLKVKEGTYQKLWDIQAGGFA